MRLLELAVLTTASACVVDVGESHYDFTSLDGKQLSLQADPNNLFAFTFCQASQPCGSSESSFCQHTAGDTETYSLGVWANITQWTAEDLALSGKMYGDTTWCPSARLTSVAFQCVNGPPKFVSMVETQICTYAAVIEVPQQVCTRPGACCTPPTFAATRLEKDGTTSVVQADAASGNWYDSDYQGKKKGILCSQNYNRCFTFTDTTCDTAPFSPAPSQCFGQTTEWTLVKTGALVGSSSIEQTAWFSASDASYVVTMPLGSSGSCVVVSGSNIDTSFEFNLTPNSTLWNVPKSCIKAKY